MKKTIYIVIRVVFISLSGLIIGKLTIGFVSSALLLLITGSFGLSVSQQSIEMISDNVSFLGILFLLHFYVEKMQKHKVLQKNMIRPKFPDIFWGAAAGGGICSAVVFVSLCTGSLKIESGSFHIFVLVCSFFSIFIQAGIEEILFRGYLLHELNQEWKGYMAVLISAAVFAAVHLFNQGITISGVINIFLISIFLSMCSIGRNSLCFVIGFHTFWNYTEEMIFGLPNSGMTTDGTLCKVVYGKDGWFYDQSFGIEASIQTTLAFVLASIGFVWIMKNRHIKMTAYSHKSNQGSDKGSGEI